MISGRQKKISALMRLGLCVFARPCVQCSAVQCTWSVGQIGVGQVRRSKQYVGLRSVTSRTTASFQSPSPLVRESKFYAMSCHLSIPSAVLV